MFILKHNECNILAPLNQIDVDKQKGIYSCNKLSRDQRKLSREIKSERGCKVIPLVGFPRILSLEVAYCAAVSEKNYVLLPKGVLPPKQDNTYYSSLVS